MPDLLFVLITVAFFVVAAGFVTVCDRVIGLDPQGGDVGGAVADEGGADTDDPAKGLLTGVEPR